MTHIGHQVHKDTDKDIPQGHDGWWALNESIVLDESPSDTTIDYSIQRVKDELQQDIGQVVGTRRI